MTDQLNMTADAKAKFHQRMEELRLKDTERKERLLLLGKSQDAVSLVCEEVEGGIYKRIDEHREFVRLLIERAPEFLNKHDWVTIWLSSQDRFLVALEKAAQFNPQNCIYETTETWPRDMPKSFT